MREDGEENPARPAATPPAGSSREPAAPAAAAPEPGAPQGQFPAGEAPEAEEAEEAEAGFPGPGLPDPGFPELDFSDAGLPEPDVPDPEDVAEPEDLGGWEEFRRPGESAGPLAPAVQRDPAPARQADSPAAESLPADSASADSPRPAAPAPTDAPAGPELTAIAPAEGLSAQDTAVLALESRGGRMRGGAKERVIREQLEMSPTRYYQLLNALLDDPAALRHAPVTVNRLRRVRDDRRAQR